MGTPHRGNLINLPIPLLIPIQMYLARERERERESVSDTVIGDMPRFEPIFSRRMNARPKWTNVRRRSSTLRGGRRRRREGQPGARPSPMTFWLSTILGAWYAYDLVEG